MQKERMARLAQLIEKSDLTGVALNAGPSLTYCTGLHFHLMERPVVLFLVPGVKPVLVLPRLEAAKIEGEEGIVPFFYDENPLEWEKVFSLAIEHLGVSRGRLGLEPLHFRYLEYALLQSAGDLDLVDGSQVIKALRVCKDEDELQMMRRAVEIAEKSLAAVLPQITSGMEERELASELVLQLFRHGSDSTLPFSPIIAGGPNGANPHSQPSSRRLQEGDLLVIDWGARYNGYASDITRTFAVGDIDEESIRIHEIVQQANEAGRAAGGQGVPCSAVDRAAREVVEAAGFGEYFTHRTGHGIGLQCHEEPYMQQANETVLEVGMSYTVEPGIYLPGKNGVRIEDDVHIAAEGAVSLSRMPRSIVRVG